MVKEIVIYLEDLNFISIFLRVLMAVIFGGIIGYGREREKRPAGLRTHILVSVGATLAMITNIYLHKIYNGETDLSRLGAQVISGIGFLGAGTIIVTGKNKVRGLTTAAGLWACACMGLAIGAGFYSGAIIGCLVIAAVTVALGFRAGFSFSAGLTDLVFSASLPAHAKTWMIIPIGIAAAIVFYVVFRFAITTWNLKTPGREDDEEDETKIELANDDFTSMAAIILEGLGGKDNVTSVDNCITRLRLEIKDYTAVDEKKIKSAGISGVIRPSKTSVQVIIGPKVQFVADEFKKLM